MSSHPSGKAGPRRSAAPASRATTTPPTKAFTRVGEHMQRAAIASLTGVAHDAELASQEARETSDLAGLTVLQWEWAAQEWGRGLQAASSALGGWLEIQAAWWGMFEASASAALGRWMVDASPAGATDSRDIGTAMANAWLSALHHDLQRSP